MIWWITCVVSTLIGFATGVAVVYCWLDVANKKLAKAEESVKTLVQERRRLNTDIQSVRGELRRVTAERDGARLQLEDSDTVLKEAIEVEERKRKQAEADRDSNERALANIVTAYEEARERVKT